VIILAVAATFAAGMLAAGYVIPYVARASARDLLVAVCVISLLAAAGLDLWLPAGDPWLIAGLTVLFTAVVVAAGLLYRDARAWRHEVER
jgi:hypothetical protein